MNEALRDAEGKARFLVHPRCTRLLADFKNLKTDAQGLEDKRDHALSHSSSAEGYRVHYLRPLWLTRGKTVGPRIGVG